MAAQHNMQYVRGRNVERALCWSDWLPMTMAFEASLRSLPALIQPNQRPTDNNACLDRIDHSTLLLVPQVASPSAKPMTSVRQPDAIQSTRS